MNNLVSISWRRWKLGLIIGCLTGVFSGGVLAFVDSSVALKTILFMIAYNICQNALLYLKDHPVEKIEFDDPTAIISRSDVRSLDKPTVKEDK